jgi:hypothetical protein
MKIWKARAFDPAAQKQYQGTNRAASWDCWTRLNQLGRAPSATETEVDKKSVKKTMIEWQRWVLDAKSEQHDKFHTWTTKLDRSSPKMKADEASAENKERAAPCLRWRRQRPKTEHAKLHWKVDSAYARENWWCWNTRSDRWRRRLDLPTGNTRGEKNLRTGNTTASTTSGSSGQKKTRPGGGLRGAQQRQWPAEPKSKDEPKNRRVDPRRKSFIGWAEDTARGAYRAGGKPSLDVTEERDPFRYLGILLNHKKHK